jgi:hypothetical protein
MTTNATVPQQAPPPPMDGPNSVSMGMGSSTSDSGLPPGAVVTPLSTSAPSANTTPTSQPGSQSSGLPPGAVITPLATGSAPAITDQPNPSSGPLSAPNAPAQKNIIDKLHDEGILGDTDVGVLRGAARTYTGLEDILAKIAPNNPDTTSAFAKGARQFANEPNTSFNESLGQFGEGAAEYLLPESWAKMGLSMGMKASEAMNMASTITKLAEKYPALTSVLRGVAEQGAAGGTQGYVDSGGDTGAAATEAATTGGAAGVLGGIGKGLGNAISKIAPTVEKVGGVDTVIPADLKPKPTPEQATGQQSITNAAQDTLRRNLEEVNESRQVPDQAPGLPTRTGPYQFKLKGQPTVETPGSRTTIQPNVEYRGTQQVPNPNYTPIEGPSYTQQERELGTSAGTIPDSVRGTRSPARVRADQIGGEEIQSGDQRFEGPATVTRPRFQQTSPGGVSVEPTKISGQGELTTEDPNVATDHLNNLNRAIDSPGFETMPKAKQAQLLSAREDVTRQLGEYRQQFQQAYPGYGKPNFEQIDIPSEIQKAGSFSDAQRILEGHAKSLYDHFNDLTDDKFNAIRQENKDAWTAYVGASGTHAQGLADAALSESNRKMAELMDSIHGAVSPKELDGANDAYRNSQILHAVSEAVDSSFSGNTSSSARSWEYRGFNGTQLMGRLNRVTQKLGRPALERVMGKENLDTLYQVARLNSTNQGRAKFGEAVNHVAQALISHRMSGPILAATGGGALGHATGAGYAAGAFTGELAYGATRAVANAIKTNPKFAKNLIFALDAGARPENYAPLLAGMIAQSNKPQSKETTAEQGDNR